MTAKRCAHKTIIGPSLPAAQVDELIRFPVIADVDVMWSVVLMR
jgi:hypothetical protein